MYSIQRFNRLKASLSANQGRALLPHPCLPSLNKLTSPSISTLSSARNANVFSSVSFTSTERRVSSSHRFSSSVSTSADSADNDDPLLMDITKQKTGGGSGFADLTGINQLPSFKVPCVKATPESVAGYGEIIDSIDEIDNYMKNTRWPKVDGWRSLSEGTGDEQLPTVGYFHHYWNGSTCHADNHAVSRMYKVGLEGPPLPSSLSSSSSPADNDDVKSSVHSPNGDPVSVIGREMNYHPCGSQCIFPLNQFPFVLLLASPQAARQSDQVHSDDVQLDDIRAFWFDGTKGFHIPAGVWHQPAYACKRNDKLECLDMQSSVHACVVCDTINEFGVTLEIPLQPDNA